MNNRRRLNLGCLAALLLASNVQAQTFRDPMRPAGATTATRPASVTTLKLEGVISGAVRVAIVNGRLVRPGDEIAGAVIVEILPGGVRFSRAGRIQTLMLPGANANANVRVARSAKAAKP